MGLTNNNTATEGDGIGSANANEGDGIGSVKGMV